MSRWLFGWWFFGHHIVVCWCTHTHRTPVCHGMKRALVHTQCICILLKISHLFSFRHVSRLSFGISSRFFFGWSDYTVSSFRLFPISFHVEFVLIICWFLSRIFYYSLLSAWCFVCCFHFDQYINRTSGGFVTIHGVLWIVSFSLVLFLLFWIIY